MKRKLLALFLSVLMMLSALPLTALANTDFQTLFEGDTVMYKKTLNADGSTYTVTVSDPTGDGVIPNLSTDNKYQEMPWYATDVTVIIFDETITEIGTFTVCLNKGAHQVTDIHFKAPKVTAAFNAVVDYTGSGLKATVHAYSTWDFALSEKFAGISYYEAEEFDSKYAALWEIKNAEAESHKATVLAATSEFDALPEVAQTQLAARKIKLDALNATLNGDTPAVDDAKLLFPDDTITVEKLLNTDGVTYTVVISDPTGDGALPARISGEYEGMPWHDYDVTTVIFDETITSLVSLTIRLVNSHKIKEIHFKAPEVKTVANCVVDYSNEPGRKATVYAYSTWTFALSAKFAGIVYYEAKEFIDEYASLWSLSTADAPFYEKDIAAAVAAYALVPSVAKTQLITQKAKLDELSEAIGLETPETNENLLFENDTVLFKKALNDDGETYTVTVSDPMGDGILPNLSSIAASMPWHTNDVTAVIFDETIVGISAQTIYLTSTSQIIQDIYFLAPYVSVPVNAIVDYSNAPGRQATVHAHGTFTYELSEKFAGVSY
ncbi:MAG: hypothetical protein J6B12_00770, partial [Clostridia bacterium]|nr:hypothetical protein [Clostridia bacterium]